MTNDELTQSGLIDLDDDRHDTDFDCLTETWRDPSQAIMQALSYREWLRSFTLERDEAEAHKKQWDTIGRKGDKEGKDRGHNVRSVSGDADDSLEESLLGSSDAAKDFGLAMMEDVDEPGLTFVMSIDSESGGGGDGDEFQDEYDDFVRQERERIDEDHLDTLSDEHGEAWSEALRTLEHNWDTLGEIHNALHETDDQPTLPVDPAFERPELSMDMVRQIFREAQTTANAGDLDDPRRLRDTSEALRAILSKPEYAGHTFPAFDSDTITEWSTNEGGYWDENDGLSNWRDAGEGSEPDYDNNIQSYRDWVEENGYESEGDGTGTLKWSMRGSDGTAITRSMYLNSDGQKEVHHDYFTVGNDADGNPRKIGKDALRGMMRAYEEAGVEKLTVLAALDQGGFAWARYGFLPNDPRSLMYTIENRLARLPNMTSAERDKVQSLIDHDDPKSIWRIADAWIGEPHAPGSRKVGHELLAGTSWEGSLDMKDPAQMARFKKYVGPGPKRKKK